MRRHGHWSDHLTAAMVVVVIVSERRHVISKMERKKKRKVLAARYIDRATGRLAAPDICLAHKGESGARSHISYRRPMDSSDWKRKTSARTPGERMRRKRWDSWFLPAPGRVTGRRAVRPVPASLSSLLPLPGPPTVPRPRWECPKKLAEFSANSAEDPFSLTPLFPATRRGTNMRERYREIRDGTILPYGFVRRTIFTRRISRIAQRTTTVRRCGWVGRSLAAKARWRCASAAAVKPTGQSHRAVRLSARTHARRGQSITWRERHGFKWRVVRAVRSRTIFAIRLTN